MLSIQAGFFDLDERYSALSAAGDPLERLSATGKGFEAAIGPARAFFYAASVMLLVRRLARAA